jgi:hypothetical protein
MKSDEEIFEQRVKATLDDSVSSLDAETRRRLAVMRGKAFEHNAFFSRWPGLGQWIPATALAGVAVMAMALLISPAQQGPDLFAQADTDIALELLTDDDITGDPDFYAWLDVMLLEEGTPSDAS